MFNAIGAVTTRYPRTILILTFLALALAVVPGAGLAERLGTGGVQDPSAESSQVAEAVERLTPGASPNIVLYVEAGQDVGSEAVRTAGTRLTDEVAAVPGVEAVSSFWRTPVPALRSEDGRKALIGVRIAGDDADVSEASDDFEERFAGTRDGLKVEVVGNGPFMSALQTTIQEDLLRAELIALPITLIVLFVVFGGLLPALLPLSVGVLSVVGTNAVLRGLTEFTEVSVFALNLTTALGLGLAVDYALLIVRRFREEMTHGTDVKAAVRRTVDTAGRTVAYSAITVAAALSSLVIFPLYFLRSFAYAGASVVLLSALAALIVLPAALTVLGKRLTKPRRWFGRRAAASTDAADVSVVGAPVTGAWASWSRTVMRRPLIFTVVVTGVLVVLALPFLGVRYGEPDYRQLPQDAPIRVAQQEVRDQFAGGGGSLATLMLPAGSDAQRVAAVRAEVLRVPGVVDVTPVPGAPQAGEAGAEPVLLALQGRPGTEPTSTQAQDLVRAVRDLPGTADVKVGGVPAQLVDTQASIARLLPYALAVAVGVAFVIVFLMTGGLLAAALAVVANALSLTAMLGAIVWVFQDGHLSGILGFTPTGYIDTVVPPLMACLAFGLSMDYGLFLLARMTEEYRHTGDTREAVAIALQRTGGVITAAALILATVLIAIGTSRVTNTKMLGLGVALAVLVDAAIVRTTLIPALQALTGRALWWAPGPLRRVQQRFELREEGHAAPAPAPATREGAGEQLVEPGS